MSTKSLQANPFFFLWIQLAGFLFPYPSAIVVAQFTLSNPIRALGLGRTS